MTALVTSTETNMTDSPKVSQRIREIDPDKLDFQSTDSSNRFDFDAKDRRRFQRATLEVPIAILLLGDKDKPLCKGKAVLRDLSLDGAFLTAIEVEETLDGVDAEEIGEFKRIQFTILDGPFKDVEASAKPIRVGSALGGVGVKLEDGFSFGI